MYHKTSEIFEFNKMLFIYLATFFTVALWIFRMIIYKKIIIKKTILDIPISLFLISQIVSTIISIDKHVSIFGYYGRFNGGLISTIAYILLYYGFVSNFNFYNKAGAFKIIKTFLSASFISSFIVILWGLLAKFGFDLTCLIFAKQLNNSCWTEQFKPSARMFSTLGQPNWLAAYLTINFFIGLYFFLMEKISLRLPNIFFVLYLPLSFSSILFTRSRSALLAFLISFLIFFLLMLLISILTKKNYLLKKISFVFCFLIFLLFLFKTGIPRIDKYLSFSSEKSNFNIGGSQILTNSKSNNQPAKDLNSDVTDSFVIRKIVWQGAVELGFRYPFFGTGVETFAYAYNFVRPALHNLTSEWDFTYNKAHNEYLNFLATTGFFGLGCYTLFILSVILLGLKKMKILISSINQSTAGQTEFKIKILSLILFASWFSILITNFFGFSTTAINLYFYLIPAVLIILKSNYPARLASQAEAGGQLPNYQLQFNKINLWQKFLLIIPLLIVIFSFYFTLSYFLADIYYAKAETYQSLEDYNQAIEYYSKALSLKKDHVYQDKLSRALANQAILLSLSNTKNSGGSSLDKQVQSVEKKDSSKESQKSLEEINKLLKLSENFNLFSLRSSPFNTVYWKTRASNYSLFYQMTFDKKYLETALESLKAAGKHSPTDPRLFYSQSILLSLLLSEEKDKNKIEDYKKKIIKALDAAVVLKNDYRDAYFAKATYLKQFGRKKEAKSAFEYILKNIDPQDKEASKEIRTF